MGKMIRYKHGLGNVIETPSCYVATDEHGTTLGQGRTRYDAEALIDERYSDDPRLLECHAYYDGAKRGLESSENAYDASQASEYVWEHVQKGLYVVIKHKASGKIWEFTPEFDEPDCIESMLSDI